MPTGGRSCSAAARIQAALRRWFDAHGLRRGRPAASCRSRPATRRTCTPSRTELAATDGTPGGRLYLHTSPEFACKKLLAAGETRLFTFAHVFRNRERGPLHHPEFTMLEWYRAHEPYQALMEDCAEILARGRRGRRRRRRVRRSRPVRSIRSRCPSG